jgi:predicted ABC-type ATPase
VAAGAGHPKIIIIAGPNGAGKTTFARSFLPAEAGLPRFINADLIAAGLAPFAPETAALRAGRIMLEEIALCARRGESFAFETTLSGLTYLRRISEWRGAELPGQPVLPQPPECGNRYRAGCPARGTRRTRCS